MSLRREKSAPEPSEAPCDRTQVVGSRLYFKGRQDSEALWKPRTEAARESVLAPGVVTVDVYEFRCVPNGLPLFLHPLAVQVKSIRQAFMNLVVVTSSSCHCLLI